MRAFAFGILFLLVSAAMLLLMVVMKIIGAIYDGLARAARHCVSRT